MSNAKNDQFLISHDFFGEEISVDISKVFPVVIMATMSCGKSTLINSLLGKDILPSRNEACTAKVYSILDNDDDALTKVFLTYKNGDVSTVTENVSDALNMANQCDDITQITISGQIRGVLNTRKTLLIVDTPGTNNSLDKSHEKITKKVLRKVKGGLVLYLINAEQMGINDDRSLLIDLRGYLEKHKNVSVLFVVNKVDSIDTEKESLEDFLFDIKTYLNDCGFASPEILPVSALAANLFNKVLAGERLTKKQSRSFEYVFELYKPNGLNLVSYAITRDYPTQYNFVEVNGKKYRVSDIVGALISTGIPYLERFIQNAQIHSSATSKVKVNINKES